MVKYRAKRCKYCRKPLSMYNENKYCFVHGMIGKDTQLSAAQFKLYVTRADAAGKRKKEAAKCKASSQ